MMREATASFRKHAKSGFTLIEIIVVMTLLATLLALTVPTMTRTMEAAEERRYVAEAEMVCAAVGAYIAEEGRYGAVDEMMLTRKLILNPLGSEGNPLSDRIEGYTDGSRIISVHLISDRAAFEGILYRVDKYQIEIYPGENEPIVTIIK